LKTSRRRPNITRLEVVKKDMYTKALMEVTALDKLEWHKRILVA